jgi:hypothetical protein
VFLLDILFHRMSVMGIVRQSAPEPLRYTVIPSGKNR